MLSLSLTVKNNSGSLILYTESSLSRAKFKFQMEYGIWSLHVAGELWGDPRLARRHPILPPGATQILPRAAFALSALHRPDMLPLPLTAAGPPYVPMELVTKPASVASTNAEDAEDGEKSTNAEDEDFQQRDDNEGNIEKTDQNENQVSFFYYYTLFSFFMVCCNYFI